MDEAVSMACCPQDEKAGISLLEMSVAFMATIGQWLPVLRKDATGDQWVTVPTTVGGAQALSNLDRSSHDLRAHGSPATRSCWEVPMEQKDLCNEHPYPANASVKPLPTGKATTNSSRHGSRQKNPRHE